MEWGLAVGAYPEATVEEVLTLLKEEGIRHVELGGIMYVLGHIPGSYARLAKTLGYKPPSWDEVRERAAGLKEILKTYGIRPIQMHAPDPNLARFDEAERTEAVEKVARFLELASILEAETLIVHPGTGIPGVENLPLSLSFHETISRIRETNIKSFKELAKTAENLGVTLAVENRLERVYGSRPADLIQLLEEVGSDRLGICLDTGHANVNRIPPHEFLAAIGERLVATHVHDNNGAGDQHFPPLMGSIDWEAFTEALRKAGYSKPIIYEVGCGRSLGEYRNRIRLLRYVSEKLLA